MRPQNVLRLAFAAMAVWTAAAVGLATPASAMQPESPVSSIGFVDMGTAVASRDTLAIGPVRVSISMPAQTRQVTFRFESDKFSSEPLLSFLAQQTDSACQTVPPSTLSSVVECTYTREVDWSTKFDFSFALRTTRPIHHGTGRRPLITITFSAGGASMSRDVWANRVKPESDFTVAVKHPIRGEVGDIVDVESTITNVGLDPIRLYNSEVILTAPTGTKWVGQNVAPCFGLTPSTVYRCSLGQDELGPGEALTKVWQLEILSAEVGQGTVSARMYNATNIHPEDDFVDPTPENNTAAIKVEIGAAPGSGPESPSPAPGTLPTTGSSVAPVITGGILAVALGLLILTLARRRKAHIEA